MVVFGLGWETVDGCWSALSQLRLPALRDVWGGGGKGLLDWRVIDSVVIPTIDIDSKKTSSINARSPLAAMPRYLIKGRTASGVTPIALWRRVL